MAVPVRFYRTVSVSEYADIREKRRLRPAGWADGKYLWETEADAHEFGRRTAGHYHPNGYRVVAVDVPAATAESLYRWMRLDGIGPARFVPASDLKHCTVHLPPFP